MTNLVRLAGHGDIAVITIDNPPVNALSPGVPDALAARLREADSEPGYRATIVMGAGSTFPAGADLKELEEVAFGKAPPGGPAIRGLLQQIEDASKPVIMAVHGNALGGGLELAMAGHYRVASPDARLGLPEVSLGIIPGAEGSQRLPRLVGIRRALDMCVSARPVTASAALESGLIDQVVEGDLLEGALAFARQVVAEGGVRVKTSETTAKLGSPPENAPLFEAAREQAGRFWRGMSAPFRVIEAIEAASTLPFDEGCRKEREIAASCLETDECRALIHAFFAERKARKVPDLPPETRAVEVGQAAVIGAGTMGSGIATALINAGVHVRLIEASDERLTSGLDTIRKNYRRSVERGRLTPEDVEERLGRVRPQVGYDGLDQVRLAVEAVFEDMGLKKTVLSELDQRTPPDTILASNTSTLDIDELAGATSRPESVIGLHFFNPAHVMRLMEIVRGPRTGGVAVATALELARRLRKVGVVVGNCRGFVGNRMMLPYMREAQYLVEEGATPAQVDRALYDFGMAMGIFAVDDMGGLDLQWKVRQEDLRLGLGPERPLRILPKLCETGRLGQKTGAGWYRYEAGDRTPVPDPEVDSICEAIAREAGIRRREISPDEIVERSIYAMINEAARILEEGHALRASDIDTIYLTGYGFPRWRGGPMWYADTVGLDRILRRVQEFQRVHGDAWKPSALLGRLVEEKRLFRDLDRELEESLAAEGPTS